MSVPLPWITNPRSAPHGFDGVAAAFRRVGSRAGGCRAEVLNAAERPAILAGVGALGARYEVSAVAHRLAAPVIKTLPGKAVIPDDAALSVGGIGLLGTRPAEELIDDCDVLLMVGTNFPTGSTCPSRAPCEWCRSTPSQRVSGCACRWRRRWSAMPPSR